ncbi:MAG: trypsin-like peptidase domain-containing protein [Caldilineaceae bacterium]|nr:trypsin-like peptidase domain-containing protein [Caldilineaceae bacterium]
MSDRMSPYQLVEQESSSTHPQQSNRSRKLPKQIFVTLMVALTLVLGALYAPLLWESVGINAEPALAPARIQEAQSLPVDPALIKNQEALANLYDAVAPSVVSIQVTSRAQAINIPGFSLPQDEAPLQQGQGSGFIYDTEGHIVTNNHVVDGAEEVTVVFSNGFWADAEVVATDPQADLAVIKVAPPAGMDWQPLPIAAETLRVGHTVIAMGNPFGLEGTMTIGIVSAIGRGMPVGALGEARYTLPDIIQTDAAINPGNSGGPLINLAGEVVGVNFAIESAVRSNSGVGFTIPAAIVQRVVPALIADGQYDYAYLGLSGRTIDAEVARAFDFPNTLTGVYVAEVVPGGPSETAGVQGNTRQISLNGNDVGAGGDIVTAIDDMPVRRFEDLVSYLVTKAAPGQTDTLTLLRDGEEMQFDVVLGSRPTANTNPLTQRERPSGPVSARQASELAVEATADLLTGEITNRIITSDNVDGREVWVVELDTADQTATVVIDRLTGEVVEATVE